MSSRLNQTTNLPLEQYLPNDQIGIGCVRRRQAETLTALVLPLGEWAYGLLRR